MSRIEISGNKITLVSSGGKRKPLDNPYSGVAATLSTAIRWSNLLQYNLYHGRHLINKPTGDR